MFCRRLFWALFGVVYLIYSAKTTPAQTPGVSREYPLKAAFLYNFGNYIEWPAEALSPGDAPFVIGILGPNPFGTILKEVAAAKQLQGRAIVVRELADVNQVAECHILFIGARVDANDRAAVLEATKGTPLLVVCETPGSAEQGAVINFFVEQNKVRFEINVQTAHERNLKISSKLMSLAKVVEPRRTVDR